MNDFRSLHDSKSKMCYSVAKKILSVFLTNSPKNRGGFYGPFTGVLLFRAESKRVDKQITNISTNLHKEVLRYSHFKMKKMCYSVAKEYIWCIYRYSCVRASDFRKLVRSIARFRMLCQVLYCIVFSIHLLSYITWKGTV